jgi:hypothetical protein
MADYKKLLYGEMLPIGESTFSYTSFTLDQTTDAIEMLFQADEAITITKLGYRVNTITGTSPVFKISLQGISGAGLPDGTIKGGGSPASATFTPAAAPNWTWVTLDNAYTCTRGEFLAVVIQQNSGTIDASNNANFSHSYSSFGTWSFPHSIQNNNGTRTMQNNEPVLGYASSTVAYGRPSASITSTAINSGTTPDEVAFAFTIPATLLSTYQVAGVWFPCTTPNTGTTVKLILYDGTTVLQDVTYDSDYSASPGGTHNNIRGFFDEATLSTLNAGSTYRIGIQPQTATGISPFRVNVSAQADFEAWPGGQNFWVSTRTDAGAWTDILTQRLIGGIIISDWTAGGGMSRPRTLW